MLKILRLEYIFNRRQILIVLAIFTAYFAYMAAWTDSPRVFTVTASLMIGLSMPFTILGREDKFKISSLVCSLPVRRSDVVLGKYAASWASIALGLGYAVLCTAVFPFSKISVAEVLNARTLFVSLFLISMLLAVVLPFTIRFGFAGIIILLVSTQLVGILVLILATVLRGKSNPLRVLFGAAEKALKTLFFHESTPEFLLALLVGIVAVNALALFISRALYARRDL
jgi:ABC-type transport system involved in multi-copper enzyme maturation permease subunit